MQNSSIFWGKVIQGKKRGKSLGFPTANVRLHKNISEGVYISTVKLNHIKYHALTFIGAPQTFLEDDFKAESFLLSFDEQIYGKWLSINLIKKIRGNKKFASPQALIKQMKQDEQTARKYFKI